MKAAWLTDIHLNFLDDAARQKFYASIVRSQCETVFISGDIAEAPSIVEIMVEMLSAIKMPIYFVLGNHDYYQGQIHEVRQAMTALTKMHDKLFWLPASRKPLLTNDTWILGQDGWADGRFGDYKNSRVVLNDSHMIADLFQQKIIGRFPLLEKMQHLADADAIQLKKALLHTVTHHPKRIIVLTHVPPFREACLHKGKMSNQEWLPFYSSKVMGNVLMGVAHKHPAIDFLVLCGHTHCEAKHQPLANLTVEVGKAEYYRPTIQRVLTI